MTTEPHRHASIWRRLERWAVGVVMAMMAFALERMVLRSVRKGRTRLPQPDETTTLTSKGGEVDL